MDWRERIIDLMEQRGIENRNDLCFLAGISTGTLGLAMRSDHQLKTTTMDKIAKALDTTTAYLLYGNEMGTQNPAMTVAMIRNLADLHTVIYDKQSSFEKAKETVQVGGKLDVNSGMFGWVCDQNDMAPRYKCGDLLIIDTMKFQSLVDQYSDPDTLGLWGVRGGMGFSSLFIRYLDKTADGWYLRSSGDYEPIKWSPEDEKITFVGLVIQTITSPPTLK